MEDADCIAIEKIVDDNVEETIFRVLKNIHAHKLIEKGFVVLLKPNLLGPFTVERAATTHPAVLRAVIHWVKQFQPSRIIVSDSSGGKNRGRTEQSFRTSGLWQVCQEEGVEAIPFEHSKRYTFQVSHPLVLDEIVSSSLLKEADLIINLPKIKTHELTYLTCAIKNMFGTVLLVKKAQIHAQFPNMDDFNAALADVYSISCPALTIVDGYYCQEGKGPSAGDVVKMDLILAGYDPVAIDSLVCQIIHLDPKKVIYLHKAEEKGLGSMDLTKKDLIGESVASVQREFKVKKRLWINLPFPSKWLNNITKDIFHPQITINPEKCRICGTCWKNCPVNALKEPLTKNIGEDIPIWEKNQCITCYCCAELCPFEAIEFKVNIFKNLIKSKMVFWIVSTCLSISLFSYLLWKII